MESQHTPDQRRTAVLRTLGRFACIACLGIAAVAHARDTSLSASYRVADRNERHTPGIAITIADNWLPGFGTKPFRTRLPVDVMVLNARARGHSAADGYYTLHCSAGQGPLAFVVRACGTSTSYTTSSRGRVVIHTTTVTRFSANTPIEQRDGRFRPGVTSLETLQLQSFDSRIVVHLPVGRRLLHRLAQGQLDRCQTDIRRISMSHTSRRIKAAMRRSAERLCRAADRHFGRLNVALAILSRIWQVPPIRLETDEDHVRLIVHNIGSVSCGSHVAMLDAAEHGLHVRFSQTLLRTIVARLVVWQLRLG